MRERWVVISNCQGDGLAHSIDALARRVDCTPCDSWEFSRRIETEPDHFRQYDFAVVSPEVLDLAGGVPGALPPHLIVPAFQFCAYQPDCVYVLADGTFLNGRMDSYHSMIALAAFKEGLAPEHAATFFNRRVFEIAGYFNLWSPFRDVLIDQYRACGLDIAPIFVRGSRGAPFMHTVNHPKIEILFEIARVLLTKLDQPMFAEAPMPPDGLARTRWPVYPELAELLGVRGSYLFKPADRHKPLDLIPFLAESFASFGAWDKSLLRVIPGLEPFLRRVRAEIRSKL